MEKKFDNEDRSQYNGLRIGDTVNAKNLDGSVYGQAIVFDYGNKPESIILIGKSQKPFDWIAAWCDVLEKTEDKIALPIVNSSVEVIDPKVKAFEELKTKSLELAGQCKNIVITDATSEALAVQIISKSKMYVKDIDAKRVSLKEPSLQEGREIDKLAKDLSTPLSEAITTANSALLTYKQAEETKRKKEIQRISDLKMELEFYCTQTRKEIDDAKDQAELATVYNNRIKAFPPEYAELGLDVIKAIGEGLVTYGKLKRQMLLNPAAAEEIKEIQTVKAEVLDAKIDVADMKAIGKVETKVVTGIKKTWTFEIVDVTLVPRAWMMVDEKAVAAGMKSAVEKGQLKPGDDKTVQGVRFYETESLKNIR